MSSVYTVPGGDNALRWVSLSTSLASTAKAALGASFPAGNLATDAGAAYGSASTATPLPLTSSIRLVQASAAAGKAIIGYLGDLLDTASQARYPLYNSDLGTQAINAGSRVSLQAAANSLLVAIDSAAFGTKVNGWGLLDGSVSGLTLSTTALGGKVVAQSQALTTSALGISGLDLGSDSGVADALARLNIALDTAQRRNQALQSLGDLFNDQASYISSLATASAQSDPGRLSQLAIYGNLGLAQGLSLSGTSVSTGLAVDLRT